MGRKIPTMTTFALLSRTFFASVALALPLLLGASRALAQESGSPNAPPPANNAVTSDPTKPRVIDLTKVTPLIRRPVTISFKKNETLLVAVKRLCEEAGIAYRFRSSIAGFVAEPVEWNKQPFADVLESLLKQAVVPNTYHMDAKTQVLIVEVGPLISGGAGQKTASGNPFVPAPLPGETAPQNIYGEFSHPRVTVEFKQPTSIPKALQMLEAATGGKLRISNKVGRLPGFVRPTSYTGWYFEDLLREILKRTSARITYYRVGPTFWVDMGSGIPRTLQLPRLTTEEADTVAFTQESAYPTPVVQTGHPRRVTSVAFSPDGRTVASCGGQDDGAVYLWHLQRRSPLRTLSGYMGQSPFSADGKYLVSASGNSLLKWRVASGHILKRGINAVGSPVRMAVTASDYGTITSGVDGSVRFHTQVSASSHVILVPPGRRMYNVGLSPKGGIAFYTVAAIVGAPEDADLQDPALYRTVHLWNTIAKRPMGSVVVQSGRITTASLGPDNKTLVVGLDKGSAELWRFSRDFKQWIRVKPLGPDTVGTDSFAWNPAGTRLAVGTWNGVSLYRVDDTAIALIAKLSAGSAASVAFSADSRLLAVGAGSKGQVSVWDLSQRKQITSFTGGQSDLDQVALSAEGGVLTVLGSGSVPRKWDTGMTRLPTDVPAWGGALRQSNGALVSALRSPSGELLAAAAGKNIAIRPTDTLSGKQTLQPPADWVGVPHVADFTANSERLAVGGWGGQACVFSVRDGELLRAFSGGHKAELNFASLTGDTKILVTRDTGGAVTVWDAATGKILHQFGGAKKPDPPVTQTSPPSDTALDTPAPPGADGTNEAVPDEKPRPWDQFPVRSTGWMAVTRNRTGPQYLAVTEQVKTFFYSLDDGRLLHIYSGLNPVFDPNGRYLFLGNGNSLAVYYLGTARPAMPPRALGFGVATFSPGGNRMAVTALDARRGVPVITVLDVPTLRMQAQLFGHTATVTAACFSPDETRLVTVAQDATARLWDLSAKPEEQLVATFIGLNTSDYVVVTREGYYTASKGALKQVGFRFGDAMYAFDQFDLRLNRPDLVLERLGRAKKSLIDSLQTGHRMRLFRMGVAFDKEATPAAVRDGALRVKMPEIDITGDLPLTVADRNLNFTVEAKSADCNLDRLLVYVNDVPLHGARGELLADRQVREATVPVSVRLLSGQNKIQLSVVDAEGRESMRWTGWVHCSAPASSPRLFVLAVGVSQYRNESIGRLVVADKDARDVSQQFASLAAKPFSKAASPRNRSIVPSATGYEEVIVKTLTNAEATCDNIRAAAHFFAESREEDHVILFFAGHGQVDFTDFGYYFLAHDTDPTRLKETAFSYDQLEGLLDGVKARQRLVLLDTCHSGEVLLDPQKAPKSVLLSANSRFGVPGAGTNTALLGAARGMPGGVLTEDDAALLVRELFADLRRGTGAEVIAAASGSQQAFEKGQNGVFTGSLLSLLREKQGTALSVSSLRDGLVRLVEQSTEGRQKPVVRAERVEFDFSLLLNRR